MKRFMHSRQSDGNKKYKIIVVDDESNIIDSLSIFAKISDYELVVIPDPLDAMKRIRNEYFDLMLLDFSKCIIDTDKFIGELRNFNKDLYILLLIGGGHSVPSIELINKLDIQGYFEKSNQFGQLLLMIKSAMKTISQTNLIKEINNELAETQMELEKSYFETIQTLRYTVEAKDPYTRGHSDRVSAYSVLIGKYLGLDDNSIDLLRVGGLFHDIGKIGVPDKILLKPRKLTNAEYSRIKRHPSTGAHILSSSTLFKDLIPIVEHHHERYDGKGYPSGLAGNDIPYLARITAIADAFDAMTSRRSYRDSLPIDVVISEFEKFKGIQFDPDISDVFLDILHNHFKEIEDIRIKYPV